MFLTTSGHAQQSQPAPPAAKPAKPAKASKKAPAPVVEPVLEPKALEILKAASDRLAAAARHALYGGDQLREREPPRPPSSTRRRPRSPCNGPTSCG